jgi:hypothetical protein
MKKFAIAAFAVCLIAAGAYAKGKFFATTAFYKVDANTCIQLTSAVSDFAAKGVSDAQAQILGSNGTTNYLIYLDSECENAAKFR